VTDRKKKILLIQITLFIIAISLLYFTYYNKDLDTEKTSVERIENKEVEESDSKAVNVFEDIEYKGIDLNGNRFTIKSEIADFELETPELINMKIMSAIFYFKDGTILKVKGDYGTYNNKNNNMEFRDNIEAVYGQNYLYADNLDYLNSENSLTIYGNVKGEGIEGNIMADNLEFDLSLKTLNISMFSKNQINVKLKDQ
jgi:Organic solvent tolerance protein OstA|tara:strand:+ start:1626 stop:2222 length:597 start_codon:yes stop_codon:yes gene_type:complete